MSDIVLKDRNNTERTYTGVTSVELIDSAGNVVEFGGGGGETGKVKSKAINFYDPMGEILYSYTRAEAAELTELPPGPELEGFEFAGWTSTLEEVKTAKFFLDIGPYFKKDGTEVTILIVDIREQNPSIYVALSITNSSQKATIDWGDGSKSVAIYTSGTYYHNLYHKYSTTGKKYIAISGTVWLGSLYANITNYSAVYEESVNTSKPGYNTPMDHSLLSVLENPRVRRSSGTFIGNQRLMFSNYSGMFIGCPSLRAVCKWDDRNDYSPFSCHSLSRICDISPSTQETVLFGMDTLKHIVTRNSSSKTYIPKRINTGWDIVFQNGTVPRKSTEFSEYEYGTGLIYVPDEAVDLYKADEVFAPVADCIRPISEYPDF